MWLPMWRPPPDEPEMWKAAGEATKDPDWMTRLARFDRQRTILRVIIPLSLTLAAAVAIAALMVLR
jgi:hypothetical protein